MISSISTPITPFLSHHHPLPTISDHSTHAMAALGMSVFLLRMNEDMGALQLEEDYVTVIILLMS